METARALKKLIENYQKDQKYDYRESIRRSAAICGKSETWVYHHLGLLKLTDKVAQMIERKQLSHQIGVALSTFKPEAQITIAKQLLSKEMSNVKMLAFIDSKRSDKRLGEGARRPSPSGRARGFQRKFSELAEWADRLASMKTTLFRETFLSESCDRPALIRDLSDLIEDLTAVKENVRSLHKKQLAA
jgi:hypothetical protein